MTPVDQEIRAVLERMVERRTAINAIQRALEEDEDELAQLRDQAPIRRSIEEHVAALAPREGFDISEITDADRHEIARCVIDAWMFGTAWLMRDDTGVKRQDPLRVEVRDRKMV
jgi:hypothetical protein